jgi:hypothetical protein
MEIQERKTVYVFDQETAERFQALLDCVVEAFKEILGARRIDLPDQYDIGYAEATFHECAAKQFDRDPGGDPARVVDLDEIF